MAIAVLTLLAPLGMSAQAPALQVPPPLPLDSASYGVSGLRIGILLQVRADRPDAADEVSSFFMRKAEVGFKARVNDQTHVSIELDPVNPDDPFRRTYLRLSHLPRLHVKVGMEKAPVGLEELLSSANQPLVDRSQVTDRFAAAEEVGVHLESRWDRWLFQLSVTNGGRRLLRDDNERKDLSARVVWAPNDWMSVGLAGLEGKAGPDERDRTRLNAEIKIGSTDSGFQAEYYHADDADVRSAASYASLFRTSSLDSMGRMQIQPAIRYEHVERSDDDAENEMRLLTLGLGVLLDGNRSKFQVNYLVDLRAGLNTGGLRVQYQVEF